MRIIAPDHTNWRVRDLEASLSFYRDILGLEPFGLLHLTPDPEFERGPNGGYDHLALVVEDAKPDELAKHLREAGVEVERQFESIIGARGEGPALYVRDPDGYRIELKFY